MTEVNGASTNMALGSGYQVALSQVHNTATITNTVTCRSTLTLIKRCRAATRHRHPGR